MSQVTISGAVSGLDTASIVNQLVSVQGNQQTLLRGQQASAQERSTALSSLRTRLSTLSSQATTLAATDDWSASTATSTSSSVTATATGAASGALTFDVTSVARAHTLVSSGTVASTSAQVVTGGTLSVTRDGTTTDLDVGDGSLASVVKAVNASDTGLVATAVRTGTDSYRLQLASRTTGAASAFTVAGTTAATQVLTTGTDASITVGTNPATAYTATSSTNTFEDLVPGLSFTVSQVASGVTVAAEVDGAAVADQVSTLVSTANSLLADITSKTAYDATTRTAGVLAGESSVRALRQNVLSLGSGSGAAGVGVTRDGQLSFDRTAFLEAFAADPDAVARAFGRTGSTEVAAAATSTTLEYTGSLASSRAGSYDVRVTSPAAAETWELATGGSVAGRTVTLTRGDDTVTVTAGATDTLADLATSLTTAASEAGFGVSAAVDGSTLRLTAGAKGSAGAFYAALDGSYGVRTVTGTDVAGSIDGQAADGLGELLSLPTGTGGAVGLSVRVSTTAADVTATGGAVGTVTYTPGLAQRFVQLATDANGSTGSITTAKDGADSLVDRFQDQIDAWDTRLATYRELLTRQFTVMETTLAQLKASTSALSGLIDSTSTSSSSSG